MCADDSQLVRDHDQAACHVGLLTNAVCMASLVNILSRPVCVLNCRDVHAKASNSSSVVIQAFSSLQQIIPELCDGRCSLGHLLSATRACLHAQQIETLADMPGHAVLY